MAMNKLVKYSIGVPLVGLTLLGSCTNHKGDFPPFYLNKTGTSSGIAIAFRVDVEEGAKFYGPVISIFGKNYGTINGTKISGLGENSGEVNGANISLLANVSSGTNPHVNGLEASLGGNAPSQRPYDRFPAKVNGLQIGILGNGSEQGSKCLQVGLYNIGYHADGTRTDGLGINIGGYK